THRLLLEDRGERGAVVHRLPEPAGGAGDVEDGGVLLEDGEVVDPPARGGRADRAELEPVERGGRPGGSGVRGGRRFRRCGGGGGRVDAPDPVRDFAADRDTLPELAAGTIVAPLTLDLKGAVAALEQTVPRRFGDITLRRPVPGSRRKSFAFEIRRDPFAV